MLPKHSIFLLFSKIKNLQSRQLHLDENVHQRLFARVCILCSFQKGYLVHLVEKREGAVIAGGQSSFAIPISRLVSTIKFNRNSYYGRVFQLLFLFFSQNIWYLNKLNTLISCWGKGYLRGAPLCVNIRNRASAGLGGRGTFRARVLFDFRLNLPTNVSAIFFSPPSKHTNT